MATSTSFATVSVEPYIMKTDRSFTPANPDKPTHIRCLLTQSVVDRTVSDLPRSSILDIIEVRIADWDIDDVIGYVERHWDYTIPDFELIKAGFPTE